MRTLHLDDRRSTRLLVAMAATAFLLLPAIAAEAATGSDGCDDALVTFTRDGTTGDDTAVALTAQAVEQGVTGWEMITWQAAPGTSIRAILVTLRNGEEVDVPAADTGTVEDVAAITFCGSLVDAPEGDGSEEAAVVVPEEPQAPAEPDTDDTATPDTDDTATPDTDDTATKETDEQPADTTPPSAVDSTRPTTEAAETATEPTATASPSADAEGTDGSSAPSATSGSSSSTSTTTSSSSSTSSTSVNDGNDEPSAGADSATEDEETEVLGVVIVASPDTEDEDADQDAEPQGAATDSSGSSADLAANDGQHDTTSSAATQTEQLASSPWGDRGPLQQAWLLAAAIAVGVAAGASVIRYRATTVSANADTHGENL